MSALAERDDRIVECARSGMLYKDIAKRFNMTSRRVSQICVREGVRRAPKTNPSDLKERILESVKSGKIYRRIACDHGVTTEYVSMIACAAGIRLRPYYPRKKRNQTNG